MKNTETLKHDLGDLAYRAILFMLDNGYGPHGRMILLTDLAKNLSVGHREVDRAMFDANYKGFIEELVENKEKYDNEILMRGLELSKDPLPVRYRVTEKGRNEIREEYKARHVRLLVTSHDWTVRRSWIAIVLSMVSIIATIVLFVIKFYADNG